MFKNRLKKIEIKRIEAQKTQLEQERLEKDRIRKEEEMTNDICYYGLWQRPYHTDEGMGRISNEKGLIKALHAQLKFRKKYKDSKIFNLSK